MIFDISKNLAHLQKTCGTHSCYLRTHEGKIHEFEDISRHNAMDKAVGYALMNRLFRVYGELPKQLWYILFYNSTEK